MLASTAQKGKTLEYPKMTPTCNLGANTTRVQPGYNQPPTSFLQPGYNLGAIGGGGMCQGVWVGRTSATHHPFGFRIPVRRQPGCRISDRNATGVANRVFRGESQAGTLSTEGHGPFFENAQFAVWRRSFPPQSNFVLKKKTGVSAAHKGKLVGS